MDNPDDPIDTGVLPGGKIWALFRSRLKAPGIIKGQHLILQFADFAKSEEVTDQEVAEIYIRARAIAAQLEYKKGRRRIAENGPDICTRDHFHLHIMLPDEADKLPTLVER